ncbi:MAG: M24 family metallopeptidase [Planctomycetota bacterium]|jgi:Xaa-Pro aminopeptidase
MKLDEIQDQLRTQRLDGWLFFDHHARDPIAYRVLSLEIPRHVSRRWYYWIPAEGEPRKLVHRVEDWMLDALPGERLVYSGWREQHERLAALLGGAKRVAMQYSPNCMIPYVSLVDGGTVDLVRGLGADVISSAPLVQYFEARWSVEQLESHLEAGRRIDVIRSQAFTEIGLRIRSHGSVEEFAIAEFIRKRFAEESLVTEDGPVVAVNTNSANPHYAPTEEGTSPIRAGDFVLIDMWAKLDQPRSVYYDITWTGYVGATPPSRYGNVFAIVRDARDRGVAFVQEAVSARRPLRACEVDDHVRDFIRDKGFEENFTHRTGHSIGEEVHGNGANIDNLETQDERPIIPRTCFSIEPGIYLPEFGVRCELDCYVSEQDAGPTGEVQRELVRIEI